MGIYLEIARRAVEDYRREEAERRARERREQISEAADAILRHHSARLEGGADNLERLVERLVSWDPYVKGERDIIEEAVQAAAEKRAESRDLPDTTDDPIHQESREGSTDQIRTGDREVEGDGAAADVHEADGPEINSEGLSEESAGSTPMTIPKSG